MYYYYCIGYSGIGSVPCIILCHRKEYEQLQFENFIAFVSSNLMDEKQTHQFDSIFYELIEELVDKYGFFRPKIQAEFISPNLSI